MKTILFCIISLFQLTIQATFAQVGVNTVTPQALLDIQSSNQAAPSNTDGILIPKIDEFPAINPTAAQDGMMVYATGNGTSLKGYYRWDNNSNSWKPFGKGQLEAIDEGNGRGWRLVGSNPIRHGDIGYHSVDLSGNHAFGYNWGATGANSFAFGQGVRAGGSFSIAMGFRSRVGGDYAVALGIGNNAGTYAEVALGCYQSLRGGFPRIFVETDRLLVVGNGTGHANRSDALEILKNGTITAPSFDISEITDDRALITKEYLDTPETSTPASLNTSWTAYNINYTVPGFYKSGGRIFLEGLLRKTGSFVPGETIFVLPLNYRPFTRKLCAGTQSGNTVRIDILANGEVRYITGENGSSDFISLEGISFKIN